MPARKDLPEALVRGLVEQGLCDAEIADRLGVHQSTLSQRRRKMGIPAARRNGGIDLDLDQIASLAAQGLSSREIAERLGCYLSTIEKRRAIHKIPTTRGHGSPGASNPSWKGGRTIDKQGYVLLWKPEHPDADKAGRIREHRLVMEGILGRRLRPDEVVHHEDGDPQNNDPLNLRLFQTNGEHLSYELKGKCPQWSEDGWQRILAAVRKKKSPRMKERSAEAYQRRVESGQRDAIGRLRQSPPSTDGQPLP